MKYITDLSITDAHKTIISLMMYHPDIPRNKTDYAAVLGKSTISIQLYFRALLDLGYLLPTGRYGNKDKVALAPKAYEV
ncbi:hypothetical protein [Enterovibrio baiacu]|uniref:hypothetical protein n=1 Tax=Enterovibrio baiacu TaxID=2491023 RepID=UPI001011BB52|nr:hypothetical protein [Enterovibrio baiacu]MBE1275090.1 hypothetical protein [Enterovibrio baiacu]